MHMKTPTNKSLCPDAEFDDYSVQTLHQMDEAIHTFEKVLDELIESRERIVNIVASADVREWQRTRTKDRIHLRTRNDVQGQFTGFTR